MKHSAGNILGISDFLLLPTQIHLLTVQSKYCGGAVSRSPKSSQIMTLVPGVPIIPLHLCVYRLHCSHVMAYFMLIRQLIGKWAVTVGSWQRGTLLWYHKDLAIFLYWVSREDTNSSLRDVPLRYVHTCWNRCWSSATGLQNKIRTETFCSRFYAAESPLWIRNVWTCP